MRLQVAGAALLLVSICVFASGCGTAVYGTAVTPPGSGGAAPSSSAALAWSPISSEKLRLIPARHAGGRTVRLRPTKATEDLGAMVVFPGRPTKGSKYRFEVWVRGSNNLPRLVIGLDANGSGIVQPLKKTVTRPWRQYSIEGRASSAGTLEGKVYVPNWAWVTKPQSWIEISGSIRQPITAVSQ